MSISWSPVTGADCSSAVEILQQILADPPGFIGAIEDDGAIPLVEQVAASIPQEDSILLLGIGGSALGARVLVDALVPGDTRLTVLDNIDPEGVDRTLDRLDLAHTTVTRSSPSPIPIAGHCANSPPLVVGDRFRSPPMWEVDFRS